MNCKDCQQDCQQIGCDIEIECSGYVEPSNGTKERMDERLKMMHKLYSNSEVRHIFSPSEPKTNADRIRSMTDEELAEILHNAGGNWYSEEYWLNWLKQKCDS